MIGCSWDPFLVSVLPILPRCGLTTHVRFTLPSLPLSFFFQYRNQFPESSPPPRQPERRRGAFLSIYRNPSSTHRFTGVGCKDRDLFQDELSPLLPFMNCPTPAPPMSPDQASRGTVPQFLSEARTNSFRVRLSLPPETSTDNPTFSIPPAAST